MSVRLGVAVSVILLASLANAALAADLAIQDARPPRFIDVRPGSPESVATMSAADLEEAARRLAIAVADETGGAGDASSIILLRVRDTPLTSRGLSGSQLRDLQRLIGQQRDQDVTRSEAAALYDRQLAALLQSLLARVEHVDAIYGLPVEGANAGPSNRRFGELIEAFDLIASSKKIVLLESGMSESVMASQALPNALASRAARPLVFQTNGVWRVLGGDKASLAERQVDRSAWSLRAPAERSAARARLVQEQSTSGTRPGGHFEEQGSDGGASGDPRDRRASFEVHWSVRGEFADDIDLGDLPIERDVVLFYAHELGVHPWIRPDDVRNGGMPQAMNLAEHLARVDIDINERIPDPDFAGYAVIDFEEFPFFWSTLSEDYQNYARNLVRLAHPGLDPAEVEARARADYDEAIQAFYLATLRRAKELRPQARWGYFLNAFVFAPNESLDSLAWLWNESDVLYPTIYIGRYGLSREQSVENDFQTYASATRTRLALRIARCRELAGEEKLVVPFVTWRYHGSNDMYGMEPLNDLDLETETKVGYESGADAIIIWDKLHSAQDAQQLQSELDGRVGPAIRQLMQNRGQ